MRKIVLVLFVLLTLLLTSSCMTSGEQRKQKTEEMEHDVGNIRSLFWQKRIEAFKTESDYLKNYVINQRHPSQPLYLCERASLNLLIGDTNEARQDLKTAADMLDMFFDKTKEKQALSVWGNESDKVYKGEPYERAILYMLYGMTLMEDAGQIDNALASFKRALLMDGDSELNEYRSDFGLVFLLAAKCHDLLGEKDERDAMLRLAVQSYMTQFSSDGTANPPDRFKQELKDCLVSHKLTPYLSKVLSWGGLDLPQFNFITEEEKQWLKTMLPTEPNMDFNTILVLWNGRGPWFSRSGNNSSIRMINVMPQLFLGEKRVCFEALIESTHNRTPFFDVFGDVNYQALTRGGRTMDEVQKGKSNIKDNTRKTAGFLKNLTTLPYVGLAAVIVAGGLEESASHMNAEADIRSWQCIPAEFTVAFMNLPNEETSVILESKINDKILDKNKLLLSHPSNTLIKTYHFFP